MTGVVKQNRTHPSIVTCDSTDQQRIVGLLERIKPTGVLPGLWIPIIAIGSQRATTVSPGNPGRSLVGNCVGNRFYNVLFQKLEVLGNQVAAWLIDSIDARVGAGMTMREIDQQSGIIDASLFDRRLPNLLIVIHRTK